VEVGRLVATRQINLRRIEGWRKIATAQREHVGGGMIAAAWKATTRHAVRGGRGHLAMSSAAANDRLRVQKRGQP